MEDVEILAIKGSSVIVKIDNIFYLPMSNIDLLSELRSRALKYNKEHKEPILNKIFKSVKPLETPLPDLSDDKIYDEYIKSQRDKREEEMGWNDIDECDEKVNIFVTEDGIIKESSMRVSRPKESAKVESKENRFDKFLEEMAAENLKDELEEAETPQPPKIETFTKVEIEKVLDANL